MDTHVNEIARGELGPAQLSRARVSLPGEADTLGPAALTEPPSPDPSLAASPDVRFGRMPQAKVHRRDWLLASIAVLALGGAGAWFLFSPYNTVYPIDTAQLRNEGGKLVASVGQQVRNLVAPAAKVARAPQAQLVPPRARETGTASSPEDLMREILALRQGPQVRDTPAESGNSSAPLVSREQPVVSADSMPQTLSITPPVAALTRAVPTAGTLPIPVAAASAPTADGSGQQTERPGVRTPSTNSLPTTVSSQKPLPNSPMLTPRMLTPQVLETGATPVASPVTSPTEVATAPAPGPRVQSEAAETLPAAPSAQALPAVAPLPAPAAIALEPAQPVSRETASQARRDLATARRDTVATDPVVAATELRAIPMTPAGQIEVLNLVTKLGIVIRDMRAENAALKSRVESTADRFDTAVADFDRRLALAEARGAINAAMGAETPATTSPRSGIIGGDVSPAGASGSRTRTQASPTGVQIVPAPVSPSVPSAATGGPRYRVTAASPGLAMLSLLDRSGGEGSQLQIQVGDQVPGYGRVTAIQQRGSSWIVQTDKGPDKGVIN